MRWELERDLNKIVIAQDKLKAHASKLQERRVELSSQLASIDDVLAEDARISAAIEEHKAVHPQVTDWKLFSHSNEP
jgi:hypothetical protein